MHKEFLWNLFGLNRACVWYDGKLLGCLYLAKYIWKAVLLTIFCFAAMDRQFIKHKTLTTVSYNVFLYLSVWKRLNKFPRCPRAVCKSQSPNWPLCQGKKREVSACPVKFNVSGDSGLFHPNSMHLEDFDINGYWHCVQISRIAVASLLHCKWSMQCFKGRSLLYSKKLHSQLKHRRS